VRNNTPQQQFFRNFDRFAFLRSEVQVFEIKQLGCLEKIVSTLLFPYFNSRTIEAFARMKRGLKGNSAKRTKRKIARSRLPLQRQFGLETEGRYFDLRGLFNKLNARHFGNRLRGYKVVWGRKRRERPKEYFIFGAIQEEDRVIRINPWLDQKFVPLWFLEYILYHEMLHAVVPDKARGNGRRCVHTDEFNRREREFRFYKRARRWEDENLARFLR
jgi:hypothetical protein